MVTAHRRLPTAQSPLRAALPGLFGAVLLLLAFLCLSGPHTGTEPGRGAAPADRAAAAPAVPRADPPGHAGHAHSAHGGHDPHHPAHECAPAGALPPAAAEAAGPDEPVRTQRTPVDRAPAAGPDPAAVRGAAGQSPRPCDVLRV
ncbi:hypothetical protein [Streptomyces sp. NPDC012888]|uniref:hypothetical protein n=1 Tax=Streptomyces sp. NPDC012888 TaxID=3364855 RepID=UPI0036BC1AC6